MSKTLGFEELFSDILVESRIVMNESLLELIRGPVSLNDIFAKYSGEEFYKITSEWEEPGKGRFTAKIYRFNGRILAAIVEGDGSRVLGSNALELVLNRSMSIVRVYRIPLDLLKEIVGEERFNEIVSMRPEKTEAGGKAVEVEAKEETSTTISPQTVEAEAPTTGYETTPLEKPRLEAGRTVKPAVEKVSVEDLKREIARLIGDFGLEYLNIEVSETEEIVKVFVDLNPIPTWVSLRSILYSIVYKYVELRRKYPVMKLEIRLGDMHDSLLLTKPEEVMIAAVVGRIEYELVQNGIPVKDTTYTIDREKMTLTIIIKAKKPVYPGVKIEDVARKAYEEAKKEWSGELYIRIRTGRFGGVRIPK